MDRFKRLEYDQIYDELIFSNEKTHEGGPFSESAFSQTINPHNALLFLEPRSEDRTLVMDQ